MEFATVLQEINRDCMAQYEQVRRSGACNMLDPNCVCDVAEAWELWELADVAADADLYSLLLQNFGKLMKHYEIEQAT